MAGASSCYTRGMIRRHPHTIAGHTVRRIGNRRGHPENGLLVKAGVTSHYGSLHHVHEHHITSQQAIEHRIQGEHGATIQAHVSRSQAAKEGAVTRKAKGEKPFGGHTWKTYDATLTHAQRSTRAKKAAAARKSKGIKPFAHESAATRSAAAKKAAATRKAKGEKPFSHESAATRRAAALKAARTRKARGESAFRHMSASARSAAAKRAAATRKAKGER